MDSVDKVRELVVKSFSEPDETMTFPNGSVGSLTIEGATITRATMEPGWQWSVDEKEIAGTDRCQKSHHVYVVSGTLGLELKNGATAEVDAGSAVAIPPGHDAWTIGDSKVEYVDFRLKE
jgi:mannose-6-phosphate isomerase-like protein (cupin superfamily)